ncbi:MAG: baseplate J/gp47 family protein, partial [Janthinobacterium lividum]
MSGTVTVPAVTIDATGIHAPAFEDFQTYLVDSFQAIYGADTYLGNDSQDGQFLGLFALAATNATNAVVAAYNGYSPAGAQGTGLASAVKINGLARLVPSYSTADLLVIGQAGRVIAGGSAKDTAGYIWALPASVTIPLSGQIVATATCQTPGAIGAAPGAISQINTITLGWQAVTNLQAAAPGAPVESDATLRARQAVSTALPARTVLESIVGGVLSLPGVSACQPYENDGYATDVNGLPPHSIALVVQGGDAQSIADLIAAKKTPGAGTLGSIAETVVDAYGIAHTIRFYAPTLVPITVAVTL